MSLSCIPSPLGLPLPTYIPSCPLGAALGASRSLAPGSPVSPFLPSSPPLSPLLPLRPLPLSPPSPSLPLSPPSLPPSSPSPPLPLPLFPLSLPSLPLLPLPSLSSRPRRLRSPRLPRAARPPPVAASFARPRALPGRRTVGRAYRAGVPAAPTRTRARGMLCAMDVYEALYTTRAMRRCRPDPIPEDVQARILDAAIRAPSGGNTQNWRFMLVDDPAVRARLGPIYRRCIDATLGDDLQGPPRGRERGAGRTRQRGDARDAAVGAAPRRPLRGVPAAAVQLRAVRPDGRVDLPVDVVRDARGARRRRRQFAHLGVLLPARPVLEILGVPKEDGWLFSSCVTFGYPTGRWGVAPRRPVHEVAFRNHWGAPLGMEIHEPLWSPDDDRG